MQPVLRTTDFEDPESAYTLGLPLSVSSASLDSSNSEWKIFGKKIPESPRILKENCTDYSLDYNPKETPNSIILRENMPVNPQGFENLVWSLIPRPSCVALGNLTSLRVSFSL